VHLQATGHHTGEPLVMPGLEPLPPSGKHFCLAEEVQKVKVEGDKVTEIQVNMQGVLVRFFHDSVALLCVALLRVLDFCWSRTSALLLGLAG
jgi:hypothetical protein